MKKYLFWTFAVFFMSLEAHGQLTLDDCYKKAESNYPLVRQYGLLEKSKAYNLSNVAKGWLPQIIVSAKTTYQSEVTEIPITLPGVRGLTRDQYAATVDVNQQLWDGGEVRAKRAVSETDNAAEIKNVSVGMYALKQRVNQLFFGILLLDAQISQNQLFKIQLQDNYTKMLAYVKGGVGNETDLEAIRVEQIKAEQDVSALKYNRKTYVLMLSKMLGDNLPENVILVKPQSIVAEINFQNRPEMALFDAQLLNIEARKKQINVALMPKVGVFLTGGYGRPGLNMLNRDFSAYYIGGLKLSWNISGFYRKKSNLQLLNQQQAMVEVQRQNFLYNATIDASQCEGKIKSYRDQLRYDDDIIHLRSSVRQTSERKLAGGTLSAIDLMRDVNNEETARLNRIYHEIQLLQAMYELKFTTNE